MSDSSPAPPPTPVPQRAPLVPQVHEILRRAIQQGTWSDQLPGELELSRKLQVSRMTLRAALETLTREGWVASSQGRRRRILKRRVPRVAPRSKRVIIMTAVPLERMRSLHLMHVDGLREKLAPAGFELEVHVCPTCFSARPEAALEKLEKERTAATWVLMNSTAPLQRWFMERKQPCVIVGARHPGVLLPSIGTDYHALGYHAAGQFLRRGHRQLAVILPTEEKAGHTNTVLGFSEACRRCAGAEVRVARHDGTPRGLRQCLDTLRHEVPPTGLLVALPSFIVGTVTELIAAGVQVGREVSVIGRDSDTFLEFVVPSVARYAINVPLYVRKLSRLVLTIARGGVPSKRDTFLVPEFVPGHSLGPVAPSGT